MIIIKSLICLFLITSKPLKANDEKVSIPLSYHCDERENYNKIRFVAIQTSDGQNLITSDWDEGENFETLEYQSRKKTNLRISPNTSLTLEISYISINQPREVLKDWFLNKCQTTPLNKLKKWKTTSEEVISLTLDPHKLFDLDKTLKTSQVKISCQTPEDRHKLIYGNILTQ